MKKILFPTDFSEVSQNAFRYALRLAQDRKAEIITVHAYELPQFDYAEYPIPLQAIYQVTELGNFENYKQHVPLLHEIAESIGLGHIKISNVLECGDLVDILHTICRTDAIDCIVMGTKGSTGLVETFLGSVSSKVMHNMPVPVFAIPALANFESIRKMLFLTNFDKNDQEALRQALDFAKHYKGSITCLHIGDQPNDQCNKRLWEKDFPGSNFINIEADLGIEIHIMEFLEKTSFDLLVMPLHHKSILERIFQRSLSKKLSMQVSIPMMAIPIQ